MVVDEPTSPTGVETGRPGEPGDSKPPVEHIPDKVTVQTTGQGSDAGTSVPAGTPAKALEEPCVHCVSMCETL